MRLLTFLISFYIASSYGAVSPGPASGRGNATLLQGIAVSSTAPTNGQVITYNSTTLQWEPQAGGGGGTTYTANQYGLLLSGATNVSSVVLAPNASTALPLISGGASANPGWAVLGIAGGGTGQITAAAAFNALSTPPTTQTFTATGTTTGYWFTITSGNATLGATYKDNSGAGNTYTVLATVASSTTVFMSCSTCTSPTSTLVKQTGSGDSTLTFSAATAIATYTTPANAKYLKVTVIGGGGGGGGAATASGATVATGGGGGGGATVVKWIASPAGSYYYSVGTGGAGGTAGANNGVAGVQSTFNITLLAGAGALGQGSGAAGTIQVAALGGDGGTGAGGDFNITGNAATNGIIFSTTQGVSGQGGATVLGGGGRGLRDSGAAKVGGAYGGGGGGAITNTGGTTATAGGNGAAGVIIVEEFY